jgi:hypothetical protein
VSDRILHLTRASDLEPASRGERRRGWGPWDIDPDVFVLWTVAPGYRYEVDLEECTTSAQVLDWVCQVAGKTWADNPVLAGLVRALDDVLAPQVHRCSCGRSTRLGRAAIRRLVTSEAP